MKQILLSEKEFQQLLKRDIVIKHWRDMKIKIEVYTSAMQAHDELFEEYPNISFEPDVKLLDKVKKEK